MRIVILASAILFLSSLVAVADSAVEHSWDSLSQLSAGQQIVVVQKDMKSHEGKFQNFTPESISIRENEHDATIQRKDVLRVSMRGKPKRFRNALIGGLVGSVAGSSASSSNRELWVPVGGWVGVAVGALLPLHPLRTIYRAAK